MSSVVKIKGKMEFSAPFPLRGCDRRSIKGRYQAEFHPARERTILVHLLGEAKIMKIRHPDFILVWFDKAARRYLMSYHAFTLVPTREDIDFLQANNIIGGQVCLGKAETNRLIEQEGIGNVFWNTTFDPGHGMRTFTGVSRVSIPIPKPILSCIKLLGDKMGREFYYNGEKITS